MEGAGSVRRNSSWRRENQTSGSDCSKKRNQEVETGGGGEGKRWRGEEGKRRGEEGKRRGEEGKRWLEEVERWRGEE